MKCLDDINQIHKRKNMINELLFGMGEQPISSISHDDVILIIKNNFNLHFLFDPYIADNLGSTRTKAMQDFIDRLDDLPEVKELMIKSIQVTKLIEKHISYLQDFSTQYGVDISDDKFKKIIENLKLNISDVKIINKYIFAFD